MGSWKNKWFGMEGYESQEQQGEKGGNRFLLLPPWSSVQSDIKSLFLSTHSPEPKLEGEVVSQLEPLLTFAPTLYSSGWDSK